MPQLGLGVYKAKEGDEAYEAVSNAIKVGYRSIDTASLYGNEESVGRAVIDSKIPRNKLFITTKLWNSDQGYDSAFKAFENSLNKLSVDYIDLYLIHWPNHDMDLSVDTWRAFEEIYKSKKARAIGVSNFKPKHLEHLLKNTSVVPAVNQIELHPYMAQLETRDFCQKHDIKIESWSPLMQGGLVLKDSVITALAKKYTKSPAQVVIRWHIQNGLIVIPKSVTKSRIKENFDVFDFELSKIDMQKMDSLNKNMRVGPDPDGMAIRTYTSVSKMFKSIKPKKD
jgi:diketogulonate reductase-like aldo/keto reductase